MEEQSLRRDHGGLIWGASGSPLGSICLGVIWEHLDGLRLRRHLGDTWRSDLRNRNTYQLKCKSSIISISRGVFEGIYHQVISVNYELKCSPAPSPELPYTRPLEPLQINLFGEVSIHNYLSSRRLALCN
jgi:hypothetical protein